MGQRIAQVLGHRFAVVCAFVATELLPCTFGRCTIWHVLAAMMAFWLKTGFLADIPVTAVILNEARLPHGRRRAAPSQQENGRKVLASSPQPAAGPTEPLNCGDSSS